MDTPGFNMDPATAWIDDQDRINVKALMVEIESAPVPFECPHPGDIEYEIFVIKIR